MGLSGRGLRFAPSDCDHVSSPGGQREQSVAGSTGPLRGTRPSRAITNALAASGAGSARVPSTELRVGTPRARPPPARAPAAEAPTDQYWSRTVPSGAIHASKVAVAAVPGRRISTQRTTTTP